MRLNITISEDNADSYKFFWNNTGSWVNDTVGFYDDNEVISTTKTNLDGNNTCWGYWANDTSGNQAQSDILCFTATSDTCTTGLTTCIFDCSDNCTGVGNLDCGGKSFLLNNSDGKDGEFKGNITDYLNKTISSNSFCDAHTKTS